MNCLSLHLKPKRPKNQLIAQFRGGERYCTSVVFYFIKLRKAAISPLALPLHVLLIPLLQENRHRLLERLFTFPRTDSSSIYCCMLCHNTTQCHAATDAIRGEKQEP